MTNLARPDLIPDVRQLYPQIAKCKAVTDDDHYLTVSVPLRVGPILLSAKESRDFHYPK